VLRARGRPSAAGNQRSCAAVVAPELSPGRPDSTRSYRNRRVVIFTAGPREVPARCVTCTPSGGGTARPPPPVPARHTEFPAIPAIGEARLSACRSLHRPAPTALEGLGRTTGATHDDPPLARTVWVGRTWRPPGKSCVAPLPRSSPSTRAALAPAARARRCARTRRAGAVPDPFRHVRSLRTWPC